MPTQAGEYCVRCGKPCTSSVEQDSKAVSKLVYRCPDHGIMLITDAPANMTQAEAPIVDATLDEENVMQE